ncbi:MAG TPA: hypothetical protein VI997_09695 [Candidatus Thermoplasmatota archaeon]|nr:hypothetical protein [Candidatus Thermoplasmatota archaeon]
MAYLQVFESILLVAFGAFTLLAGSFTAYFGAGRSRKIGLGLLIVGLLAILLFASFTFGLAPGLAWVTWPRQEILYGLMGVVGATIGGILALTLFIFAIMRA